ncbi:MAG: cytochrome-c oxidase, cbb3-type subunit III [Alphaproteobacteria bacterium]|nr:MAG: cytochrome-c oxidase, cbb3-type subunit III [Alphaproteobacteria bacterium]
MSGIQKPPEKDSLSGVETTGHEWDGLKELNNPTPRWWLWIFLVTIVWSVWYWVVYPAWPTLQGHTPGSYGWTQHKQLLQSQQEITQRRAAYLDKMKGLSLEDIRHSPELYEFALAGGAVAFKENCAACHGTGAQGRAKGYPNLNDDDWLWGGRLDDIYKTIRVGVNSGHESQRGTQMPAFGRDGLLKREQIEDVTKYVKELHKKEMAEETDAYKHGREIFATNCSSCHGKAGEGNAEVGAPRLNDEIWLWGGDEDSIHNTITNAHLGVMPTWEHRLDDDTIKMLSIYVHSLGGGK